jgi:hypothetical protein
MSDKKKDLTRIEDLSDYLHQDNAETDAALSVDQDQSQTDINVDLADLADDSGIINLDNDDTEEVDEEIQEEFPDYLPEGEPEELTEETTQSNTTDYDISESYLDDVDCSLTENTVTDDDNEESEIDIFDEERFVATEHQAEEFTNEEPVSDSSTFQEDDIFEASLKEQPQVTETDIQHEQSQNHSISEILFQEQSEIKEDYLTEAIDQTENIYTEKEKFSDLNEFAKSITYGEVATGGNPPFSVILKNIVYKEDAEDILVILREHKLVNDQNEETMKAAMENGSILISQISEYSAIYLAHKFRRFNIDVLLGLSEELHPAKSYDRNNIGLTSKRNIKQNERDSYTYSEEDIDLDNILLATTPTLQDHVIRKYISIVSEHKVVEESELLRHTEQKGTNPAKSNDFDFFEKNEDRILENISFGLDQVYMDMANLLKEKCLKLSGNAVVGINFQLTPLFTHSDNNTLINYKITATGNVVWVVSQRNSLEHS